MCIKFESRKVCVAVNRCDNSDFWFSQCGTQGVACDKNIFRWRKRRLSTIETKRDSGFFGNHCDSGNNYSYSFNLFSRVTVNVLVFILCVVFHVIVYIVTRYMYDAQRRSFALSASFVCFVVSEVTTRKGNKSIVQKGNCFVEEIRNKKLNWDPVVGNLFITEVTIQLV